MSTANPSNYYAFLRELHQLSKGLTKIHLQALASKHFISHSTPLAVVELGIITKIRAECKWQVGAPSMEMAVSVIDWNKNYQRDMKRMSRQKEKQKVKIIIPKSSPYQKNDLGIIRSFLKWIW